MSETSLRLSPRLLSACIRILLRNGLSISAQLSQQRLRHGHPAQQAHARLRLEREQGGCRQRQAQPAASVEQQAHGAAAGELALALEQRFDQRAVALEAFLGAQPLRRRAHEAGPRASTRARGARGPWPSRRAGRRAVSNFPPGAALPRTRSMRPPPQTWSTRRPGPERGGVLPTTLQ